ncbi:hypothetical protein F0562_030705 [Nyssa sinensis]|uniref:Neprosin activation peptide domain-containing protein n=1 Tax=Nyssa sinensis TaxID=561372 RepID=A0A5J5B1E1_9ASTE|nr:hypothetical protein F0562_030705 [Nyssa sinensis]
MMRSSNIIFFCLLATALYFASQSISSSPPLTFLSGRRPLREFSISSSKQQHQYQKIKVNEEMKGSTNREGSTAIECVSSNKDAEKLLYHIDYHGVTTHPTPKHP